MNKKLLLSLFVASAVSPLVHGAPVSPEESLVRLGQFATDNATLRMKAPAPGEVKLAYTAVVPDAAAFYVFNKAEGGFVILSADDRLPAVLGFTDSGEFDIDRISPNMKWWLDEYKNDIRRMYSAEGIGTPAQKQRASVAERKPIEPMVSTRWDQMAPYNELTPNHYPTGCVATAMAQVMKYHRWPEEPTGSHADVTFDGTYYEWDLMLDVYKNGSYTMEEANAVATLMRQCGAAVDMMYTPWASGAYSHNVPVALYTYFGYTEGMRLMWRDYHSMSEWNDIVYAELEAKRPVYYSGSSSAGGHAFVCDGYLGNNFFHFNWGWGGYQDGYFLLNALNPGVGGTGSYAGGYNSSQQIITGVEKAGAPAKRQVAMLSTGSFIYDTASGSFGVGSDPTGYNMFYNPLAYNVSGSMGLKVTPENGGESKYFKGTSFSLSSFYGLKNFTVSVSGLTDGRYRCEPVFQNDGEWFPVQIMMGTQRSVVLSVENGKYNYINEGIPASELPSLLSGLPRTMPKVHSDAAKVFRVTVLNVSGGDYNNDLTMSLYEQGKPDGGHVLEVTNHVTVPGNASLDVDFVFNEANLPGVYDLYLTDYEGHHLIAPASIASGETVSEYTVRITDSGHDISSSAQMVFTDISPNFWTLGKGGIGLMMEATNKFYAELNQKFTVKLLKASDYSEVFNFGTYSLKLDSGEKTIVNFTETEIDLKPGYYYWQVTDPSGNALSRIYPMIVNSEAREQDGIWYEVYNEDNKRARVIAPRLGEYEGQISIPSSISGYLVDDLKADAFTFASEVTSVSIPFTVKAIENGSFYKTTGLKDFGVFNRTPPALYPSAFAPGMKENIVFDTYVGSANLYANTPLYDDFIYSSWKLNVADGIRIDESKLETDPMTGKIYNPYFIGGNEALSLEFILDDPEQAVFAEIDIEGEKSTDKVYRKIWLPFLHGRQGEVTFSLVSAAGVDEAEAEMHVTVIRPDGTVICRNADREVLGTLPRGLYIVNGRKTVLF